MGYGAFSTTTLSQSQKGSGNLGATLESADATLKQWYIDNGKMDALLYKDKILSRVQRLKGAVMEHSVGGAELVIPIEIGEDPGQSKDFGVAQKIGSEYTYAMGRWIVKVDSDFGVARISNKLILATKSKRGSFTRQLKKTTDKAIKGMKRKRVSAIFAPGGSASNTNTGHVAVIKSINAGSKTITITDPSKVSSFELGYQFKVFAPSARLATAFKKGTTTVTDGVLIVSNVNRDKGIITFTNYPTGGSNTPAVGDYLFRNGDFGKTGLYSFEDWLPEQDANGIVSSVGNTLGGLDRSRDVQRLAGFYKKFAWSNAQSTTNDVFRKVVRKLIARILNLTGETPNAFYCNPLVEDYIAQELQNNIRFDYDDGGAAELTKIGMGRLAFKHSEGMTEIVASAFVPVSRCFLVDESTWGLFYLGDSSDDFIGFAKNEAGGIITQAHDAPGKEIRVESYGQFACVAPGCNARIDLPSALVDHINQ